MKNFNLNLTLLGHVSNKEKVFFARQLAVMVSSGVPIDNAIALIRRQTRNEHFKKVLDDIYNRVEAGENISACLEAYPKIFDAVFVSVVRSGEASGKIDKVLTHLADRMERMENFKGKIKSALAYPIFIICAMVVVIIVMMIKVIPVLKTVFDDAGVSLPWTTRFVLGISDFLIKYGFILLAVLVVLAVGVWLLFTRTSKGRFAWDVIKLKTPIVSFISYDLYMSRFADTLGMLISAGVPIIETLKITTRAINNRVYTRILRNAIVQVERGVPLSVPLEKEKEFPVLVAEMIMVGEQTGKLEVMMDKLAQFYETEVDNKTKTIANLIEPVMIVIVGLGVGFLIYSILYPIYGLVQVI